MNKRCNEVKFDCMDFRVSDLIREYLKNLIKHFGKGYKEIAVVCPGNPESASDSIGPMIGSILSKLYLPKNTYLYGEMDSPISDNDIYIIKKMIAEKLEKTLVIAIDAFLGRKEDIGKVLIYEGPIKPGSALGKNLPEIGDISIDCVVNSIGFFDFLKVNPVNIGFVHDMAFFVSYGVYDAIYDIYE